MALDVSNTELESSLTKLDTFYTARFYSILILYSIRLRTIRTNITWAVLTSESEDIKYCTVNKLKWKEDQIISPLKPCACMWSRDSVYSANKLYMMYCAKHVQLTTILPLNLCQQTAQFVVTFD